MDDAQISITALFQLAAFVSATGGAVIAFFLRRESDIRREHDKMTREILSESNDRLKELNRAFTATNTVLSDIQQQLSLAKQVQEMLENYKRGGND